MLTAQDMRLVVMDELGYKGSPSLVSPAEAGQLQIIPHLDNVYVVNGIQVAYFSQPPNDEEKIAELYQQVWSESRVPILYVFLPQEVRVYNCYAVRPPAGVLQENDSRLLQHLTNIVDVQQARIEVQAELAAYERLNLDTGAFWSSEEGQRIDIEGRADRQLLRSISELRRQLRGLGLTNKIAYILLGRTIMIRCLEDRGLLEGQHLREVLADRQATYDLFDQLADRFNGDLFPVDDDEPSMVQSKHLDLIRHFLNADNLISGQLSLWHYNFKYIPVELISNIYEIFLPKTDQSAKGAYYTPPPLADFILDWSLPSAKPSITSSRMTILDPACGSGIFLSRAFRRLVTAWVQENGRHPRANELATLLTEQIFGVDVDPIAVQIAAFSLYLAMLDYVDADEVRHGDFRFPSLRDRNLLALDFFDPKVDQLLAGRQFDRIVGNLPWGKDTLKRPAKQWLKSRQYTVPNKQAAQAFLLRLLDFCAPDGEIAVLAPTHSTLGAVYGEAFRTAFWKRADVRSIVNFSTLRTDLFASSLSPSVALFYKTKTSAISYSRIVYAVPKPSPLFQQLGAIVLDGSEVKYLDSREFQHDPALWKVAMWGTARDAELIHTLQDGTSFGLVDNGSTGGNTAPSLITTHDEPRLSTLGSISQRLGWNIYNGIKVGKETSKKRQEAVWLVGQRQLSHKQFRRYVIVPNAYDIITETLFERPRSAALLGSPVVLIKRSPDSKGLAAAYSDEPMAYLQPFYGLVGRAGQESLLKWLTAVINSRLAIYYMFLVSSGWAIERDVLLKEEYEQLPFFIPSQDDPHFQQVLKHFDDIVALLQQADQRQRRVDQQKIMAHEAAIEKLVFELYGLTIQEQQLVNDMVEYGVNFFYWSINPKRGYRKSEVQAVQSPSDTMLEEYADTFAETVTALLKRRELAINTTVYHVAPDDPLSAVSFRIVDSDVARPEQVLKSSQELQERLRELNQTFQPQAGQSLYMRRHVRIYDGNDIDFVRPSERRFWTKSQALADADAVIADLLHRSRYQKPDLVSAR